MQNSKAFQRYGAIAEKTALLVVLTVLAVWMAVLPAQAAGRDPDYSQTVNWAYYGLGENKPADLFIVAPSVFRGDETTFNMSLQDEKTKQKFLGALNMEQGIYADVCRMYSPYYRQASLSAYTADMEAEQAGATPDSTGHSGSMPGVFNLAYKDVKSAFEYYLNNLNGGRPIVMAGFSQGGEMTLRLLEDYGNDPRVRGKLIASYIIGWRVLQKDLVAHPFLKMAQGESDTGVIISFNSEDPSVTGSLSVPAGEHTYAINPLNWKTDSTPADRSLNLGACFTDYTGGIKKEIPAFTGAYLDPVRGTLKVTDVDEAMYPPQIKLFPAGVYHLYDYLFFFRNLEKNVIVRTQAFYN